MNVEAIKQELLYQKSLELFDKKINIEKIQKLFDLLMNQGVYCDEFLEIIYPSSNSYEDFIFVFSNALKAIDKEPPKTKSTAIWFILMHHIKNIANQTSDPIQELYEIAHYAYTNFDLFSKTKRFLGDQLAIDTFIAMWFEHSDRIDDKECRMHWNGKFGDEAILEIKKDAIKEAKKWLEIYQDKIMQDWVIARDKVDDLSGYINSTIGYLKEDAIRARNDYLNETDPEQKSFQSGLSLGYYYALNLFKQQAEVPGILNVGLKDINLDDIDLDKELLLRTNLKKN